MCAGMEGLLAYNGPWKCAGRLAVLGRWCLQLQGAPQCTELWVSAGHLPQGHVLPKDVEEMRCPEY